MLRLSLGSGTTRFPDTTNVDYDRRKNPDIVHDLNIFPYPFGNGTVEHIEMSHVLEHLDDPTAVLNELHRILVVGGTLHIRVPYYNHATASTYSHQHYFQKGWFLGYQEAPTARPYVILRERCCGRFREIASHYIGGLVREIDVMVMKV